MLADYFRWTDETGAEPTEAAMNGWIDADLAYQGILAAGPSHDRTKVIAATNAMTEYSADGLINAPCVSSAELADANAIRRAPTLDHK